MKTKNRPLSEPKNEGLINYLNGKLKDLKREETKPYNAIIYTKPPKNKVVIVGRTDEEVNVAEEVLSGWIVSIVINSFVHELYST